MMQNRASRVAPHVAVMPSTLGGPKLCQAAEVGLPPYLTDRRAGIATPPLGVPRANRCLHGRSGFAQAPRARIHFEPIAGADLAAVRPEIVRTEHGPGSFRGSCLHTAKRTLCARFPKKRNKE